MFFDQIELSPNFNPTACKMARIDPNHTNPRAAWVNMESPNYPTHAHAQQPVLMKASEMVFEPVSTDGTGKVRGVTVVPHGTVALVWAK